MSENLIGASQGQMNNLNGYMGDLPQVLPASAEQFPGWCLPSGTATNENQDQCINPDSFATFLGLLESVPLHGFGAKNGTDEIPFPDSRCLFLFLDQLFHFRNQVSSSFPLVLIIFPPLLYHRWWLRSFYMILGSHVLSNLCQMLCSFMLGGFLQCTWLYSQMTLFCAFHVFLLPFG
jgi:hypothetical protein